MTGASMRRPKPGSGRRQPKLPANMPRNVYQFPGASRGEAFASWGPDLTWPPIVASSWYPVGKGRLIAKVTLEVPHWRCRIYDCKVVRWYRGMRLYLPERQRILASGKAYYANIFTFLTDEDERQFYEAALRAVRGLIGNDKAAAATVAAVAAMTAPKDEKARQWRAQRRQRAGSWQAWQAQRQRIFQRDEYCCRDCGVRPDKLFCSYRDAGGDDSDGNFVTRCGHCHALANGALVAEQRRGSRLHDVPF